MLFGCGGGGSSLLLETLLLEAGLCNGEKEGAVEPILLAMLALGGVHVRQDVATIACTVSGGEYGGRSKTHRILRERHESHARWVFVRFLRSPLSMSSSERVRSSDLRLRLSPLAAAAAAAADGVGVDGDEWASGGRGGGKPPGPMGPY